MSLFILVFTTNLFLEFSNSSALCTCGKTFFFYENEWKLNFNNPKKALEVVYLFVFKSHNNFSSDSRIQERKRTHCALRSYLGYFKGLVTYGEHFQSSRVNTSNCWEIQRNIRKWKINKVMILKQPHLPVTVFNMVKEMFENSEMKNKLF